MLRPILPIKMALLLVSTASLSTLAQMDAPLLVKPLLLLLPLQIFAVVYVVWHWRERSRLIAKQTLPTRSQSPNP